MVATREVERELPLRPRVGDREVPLVTQLLLGRDAAAVGEAAVGIGEERVPAQDVIERARGRSEEGELGAHRRPDHARVEERRVEQERVHVVGMRRGESHGDARARAEPADGEAPELQGLRELVREGGVRGGGVRLVERGRAGAARQIRDEHPEARRERGEPRAEVLARPRPAVEQKERLARPHLADPNFTLHAASELGWEVPWPVQYLPGKPPPKKT